MDLAGRDPGELIRDAMCLACMFDQPLKFRRCGRAHVEVLHGIRFDRRLIVRPSIDQGARAD